MRLKFESKLNNLSSMYRELESRFTVVSREFQINTDRCADYLGQLIQNKNDNRTLQRNNFEQTTNIKR